MGIRRGRSTTPPPRKPETAADLAHLLHKQAVKLLDRGTGEAADWPLIAEAMALVMFQALDKLPNDPRTKSILRRLHSGAYSRLDAHPVVEPEAFQAGGARSLFDTFGQAAPSQEPEGPAR